MIVRKYTAHDHHKEHFGFMECCWFLHFDYLLNHQLLKVTIFAVQVVETWTRSRRKQEQMLGKTTRNKESDWNSHTHSRTCHSSLSSYWVRHRDCTSCLSICALEDVLIRCSETEASELGLLLSCPQHDSDVKQEQVWCALGKICSCLRLLLVQVSTTCTAESVTFKSWNSGNQKSTTFHKSKVFFVMIMSCVLSYDHDLCTLQSSCIFCYLF